ncbi:MAG: S1 RNA-binding domain-containing protein [Bacteroidia bacterium]
MKHPSEVLKLGQELTVRVLDVDVQRRRISLTLRF